MTMNSETPSYFRFYSLEYLREEYKEYIGKPVVSKSIGIVLSFKGIIIDVNEGYQLHFLVKRDSDGTEWLRRFDDLLGVKVK